MSDFKIQTMTLLEACQTNNLQKVQEFLDTAPPSTYDINALKTDDGGCSCLHYAVIHNNAELVKLLLRYGANPAIQSLEGGSNALHLVSLSGNVYILKQLLTAANTSGNLINAGDQERWTPLMSAVQVKNIEVVKELLSHGCDVNTCDNIKKRTALHICSAQQNAEDEPDSSVEMARLLLNYGADVMKRDGTGKTALHYAVAVNNQSLISSLLDFGASPSIADNLNVTAIDMAERRNAEMAQYMKNKHEQVKSMTKIIQAHQQPLLRENEKLRDQIKSLQVQMEEFQSLLSSLVNK